MASLLRDQVAGDGHLAEQPGGGENVVAEVDQLLLGEVQAWRPADLNRLLGHRIENIVVGEQDVVEALGEVQREADGLGGVSVACHTCIILEFQNWFLLRLRQARPWRRCHHGR